MDGAMFLAHVQKVLVPGLGRGDLVICDNLSSHKVGGVREAIEGCGAQLLYLHAYSQDLNPIGPAFAKLKAFLRQRAPLSFATAHCSHFFRHARYATNQIENDPVAVNPPGWDLRRPQLLLPEAWKTIGFLSPLLFQGLLNRY